MAEHHNYIYNLNDITLRVVHSGSPNSPAGGGGGVMVGGVVSVNPQR